MRLGKVGIGWDMRINTRNDAHVPYDLETYSMGENIWVENVETKSNGRRYQETPSDIAATMISLRVGLKSCREDNERMIKA